MAGVMRVLTLLLVMASTSASADDPLPTAKDLALRLREYQSSIKSLRVRYRTRQLPSMSISEEGEKVIGPGRPWREFLWVKDGRKEFLGEFPEQGAALDEVRLVASYDGKRGCTTVYSGVDPDWLRTVMVESERPSRLYTLFPRLLGWEIPFVNETLISLLERPGEKPISWSDRFEARCVLCDLGYLSEGLGSEHVVKAWFDPQNNWLPKAIQTLPKAIDEAALAGKPIPPPIPPFLISPPPVDEFLAVKDTLLGIERKFPAACSGMNFETEVMERTLEVISAEINPTIDRSLFELDVPPGTEVIENPNTPQETRRVAGTAADAQRFRERVEHEQSQRPDAHLLAGNPKPPPGVSGAVTAHPAELASSLWGSPWFWVGCGVLFALAAFSARRFW